MALRAFFRHLLFFYDNFFWNSFPFGKENQPIPYEISSTLFYKHFCQFLKVLIGQLSGIFFKNSFEKSPFFFSYVFMRLKFLPEIFFYWKEFFYCFHSLICICCEAPCSFWNYLGNCFRNLFSSFSSSNFLKVTLTISMVIPLVFFSNEFEKHMVGTM